MKELNKPAFVRQAEDQDAAYINAEHGAAETSEQEALEHRLNAGRRLLAKHDELTRGKKNGDPRPGWNSWCRTHLKFSRQAADRYVHFAEAVASTEQHGCSVDALAELWASTRHAPPEKQEPVAPKEPTAPGPKTPTAPPGQPEPEEPEDEVPEEVEEESDGGEDMPKKPERFPLPEAPDGEDDEPVPRPHPAGRLGKPGEYVPLSEWHEGPAYWKQVRDRARKVASPGAFNAQTGDGIEWALWSWNPVTGCRHDCPYCYARDIAERLYSPHFEPAIWPARLDAPRNTTFPKRQAEQWVGHKNVFVCSMADLFGRWVPKSWIDAVLSECKAAPQWNFLFLTKFPNRMSEFVFSDNCWVGTTVDCQARVKNAEKSFRKVKASVKWLSCEPLIEPLKFTDLGAFQWLVIGGASHSTKTPEWNPPVSWVLGLMQEAASAGVKVYVKPNCRIRQYPGLDEPSHSPAELVYLPPEIG